MAVQKERRSVIDQQALEALLKRYLSERGWRYAWEEYQFGDKKPDAVILSEAGSPVAAIDASLVIERATIDLAVNAEKSAPEDLWALPVEQEPSEVLKEIARRIARKAAQALPVMQHGLPYLLATAGCPPVPLAADRIVAELKRAPQISAFAVLEQVDAAEVYQRVLDRDSRREHRFTPLEEVCATVQSRKSLEVAVMTILLNPWASVRWGEELWGIYDCVWQWDTQKCEAVVVYDGQDELARTYRIFLLAGSVPAPAAGAISASRSENFYEERY
ncbi:MAG: hypothetical protein WHS44_01660 [Fimbriimonadales bacterium]|nr:MAG: hypothetical protein KatS3mg018_0616 [Fimbriimonadales bacterium]